MYSLITRLVLLCIQYYVLGCACCQSDNNYCVTRSAVFVSISNDLIHILLCIILCPCSSSCCCVCMCVCLQFNAWESKVTLQDWDAKIMTNYESTNRKSTNQEHAHYNHDIEWPVTSCSNYGTSQKKNALHSRFSLFTSSASTHVSQGQPRLRTHAFSRSRPYTYPAHKNSKLRGNVGGRLPLQVAWCDCLMAFVDSS